MGKKIETGTLVPFNKFELGVNKKYALSGTQVQNLGKWLREQSLSSTFLYNEQSEYLISVRAYPFWMENFFSVQPQTGVPIGPFNASETHVLGRELQSQIAPISIGSYTFSRYFNNFMDYAPYTKITAYIPYIGFKTLNVNEIMGKTVDFYLRIDFDTGMMSVWMQTSTEMIDSWESEIGVDVEMNHTNAMERVRNMYLSAIGTIGSVGALMMGGASGSKSANANAVTLGGKVAQGFIGANQHHMTRGSIGMGVNKLYNPTSIYIITEREQPVTVNSDYPKLYGLPLMQDVALSSLTGYTEIGEIHFNPMNEDIFNDEIEEITDLLKSGVIL